MFFFNEKPLFIKLGGNAVSDFVKVKRLVHCDGQSHSRGLSSVLYSQGKLTLRLEFSLNDCCQSLPFRGSGPPTLHTPGKEAPDWGTHLRTHQVQTLNIRRLIHCLCSTKLKVPRELCVCGVYIFY